MFNDYLRIPFLMLGRNRKGCDCWGLVSLIYREKLNIYLPDTNIEPGDYDGFKRESDNFARLFERVFEPELYDVILCYKSPSERVLNHVALYTGNGKGIHAVKGQGVVIEKFINNPVYKNQIEGFYRYVKNI